MWVSLQLCSAFDRNRSSILHCPHVILQSTIKDKMKIYWVYHSDVPIRNLCSDGMIRKNLKHAPDGVEFMKVRQGDMPNANQTFRMMLRCQLVPKGMEWYRVTENYHHNPRTGKVQRGLAKVMRKPILSLLAL